MILRIEIHNFKSLIDFEIELPHFNCLIGLNGAGKSTVLQAMDFLSQLMLGDIDGWLVERGWDISDLKPKFTDEEHIAFKIDTQNSEDQYLSCLKFLI